MEVRDIITDYLVSNIQNVKKILGKYSGTKLKDLIYEIFEKEVKEKRMEDTIL